MGSPKGKAAERAAASSEQTARSYYGMALPMMQQGMKRGLEANVLPGTPAPYLGRGLELGATSFMDAAIAADRAQSYGFEAGAKKAFEGGNAMSIINPAVEFSLARHDSAITKAIAGLKHQQGMMESALGVTTSGGAGGIGAASNQLQAIAMMPTVDPALAAALAAVNAAYAGYRGLSKPKGALGDGRAFSGGIGTAQVGGNGLLEMGGNE